jgi:manganese/zinc/iron transport system substrate-binding protein
MRTVDIIVRELSLKDPQHASVYRQNGLRLMQQMEAAHQEAISLMSSIPPEKRYLVTSHDAFNYFTRAYLATPEERKNGDWRKRFAAPEGLAPEGQLSAKDIQGIIDYLSEHKITVLFPESNVSKDSIKKIVNAGSRKGIVLEMADVPLYADAMGPSGSDGDTYLKMVKHNVLVIVDYLK